MVVSRVVTHARGFHPSSRMIASLQKHESFEPDGAHLPALDAAVGSFRDTDGIGDLVLGESSGLTRPEQLKGSPLPRSRSQRA